MAIYFTSDLHFWHANVITYCNRPYSSVEEMNEALIINWNEVVGPEDTVYNLGDFSFAGRPVELYSNCLNGNKKLVPGNHDPIHPSNKHHKKTVKRGDPDYWKKFYESHGWEVLPLICELSINGVLVNACHLPYKGDWADDRYDHYKPADDGRWLLCGHVHEKWLKKGKMINVGVDRHNYRPISVDRIIELMNTEGDII